MSKAKKMRDILENRSFLALPGAGAGSLLSPPEHARHLTKPQARQNGRYYESKSIKNP